MAKSKEAAKAISEFLPGSEILVDLLSTIGRPEKAKAIKAVVIAHHGYRGTKELSDCLTVKLPGGATRDISVHRVVE